MKILHVYLLPLCYGFPRISPIKRTTSLRVYPTEIMNEGGQGFGETWSYTTLLDNIKEIESVSLLRNNNEISGLVVWSHNELHRIQYISELKYNILEVLIQNHIPFDFKDLQMFNFNFVQAVEGVFNFVSIIKCRNATNTYAHDKKNGTISSI